MHIHMLTHLHTYIHIKTRITDGLNHHTNLAKLDGHNKWIFILNQSDLCE